MEWSSDFSFDYYRKILRVLSSEFKCLLLSEALRSECEKACVCIRHDIDVDPERAIPMAQIEHEYELCSTYYVMINSPLYDVKEHLPTLQKLLSMGNEIGLHFYRENIGTVEEIEDEVAKDCEKLEELLGIKVRSISFHRPPQHVLRSNLYIAGRVNVYSAKLMEWYISDSRGRFRVGEPIQAIREHRGKLLQFLTHPIWWGEKHATATERITEWFNEKTNNFDSKAKEEFARRVYEQIDVMPQS